MNTNKNKYTYVSPRVDMLDIYSIEECKANPHNLYIFGDNCIGSGIGGQAVIRHCSNAIGIPTKRYPTMKEDAFFDDNTEMYKNLIDSALQTIVHRYDTEDIVLVFPSKGLGTGLAKMKEKAPKLYEYMCSRLKGLFDYDNGN